MTADPGLIPLLSLAFGLGMVHALDADHIAAVSSLACRRFRLRESLGFSLRWALGHGLTLVTLGLVVFVAGLAIPPEFSRLAERSVALVLMGLGAWVILSLWSQKAHIHFHRHNDLPVHAHWHTHEQPTQPHPERHTHKHAAVLVGVLHGAAGSAPLLALIPVATMNSPWTGMAYLVLFSLGVLASMFLFGGLVGVLFQGASRWGGRLVSGLRLGVGLASIGIGGNLLYGTF